MNIPEAVSGAGCGACQDHSRKQDQITRCLHDGLHTLHLPRRPRALWRPGAKERVLWAGCHTGLGADGFRWALQRTPFHLPGQVLCYEEKPVVRRVTCELPPRRAALSSVSGSWAVIDVLKSGLIPSPLWGRLAHRDYSTLRTRFQAGRWLPVVPWLLVTMLCTVSLWLRWISWSTVKCQGWPWVTQ